MQLPQSFEKREQLATKSQAVEVFLTKITIYAAIIKCVLDSELRALNNSFDAILENHKEEISPCMLTILLGLRDDLGSEQTFKHLPATRHQYWSVRPVGLGVTR